MRSRSLVRFYIVGVLFSAALLGATGCASGGRPPANFNAPSDGAVVENPAGERQAVRQVLEEQQAAWNTGDLESFMAGYARTDTLRFASGGAVQRGWQQAFERYQRRYPNRAAMGTLAFSDLAIDLLEPRTALVFGRWELSGLADGSAPSGLFTLLMKKTPTDDGPAWRVVYDHTSAAE